MEQAKQYGNQAVELAKGAYNKAFNEGFFKHFGEYNVEIVRPLKRVQAVTVEGAKAEIISTLKLQPASPDAGFVLWNVIALLLGIAESFIFAALGNGYFSLLWNGALGYFVAYTLYWTMTCIKDKAYMFYSLIFVCLYIAFNVMMGLRTLIFVVPAALYFAKALCDVLMLINGFQLYKGVAGDKLML